jgi:tetrapyrrole methylase family protein/MazG family protein
VSGRLTVVGLGPAGPELVTSETLGVIEAIPAQFVRTRRHPAASVVARAATFDPVYERAETLDEVYRTIADELIAAAGREGHVLYAVPGSPLVAERTVELLRRRAADGEVGLQLLPALSFVDLAWARLGIDPVQLGVRLVDGHRFAVEAAGDRGPLLVAQVDSAFTLSDLKLAVSDAPEAPVVVLQRLGLPDESVREVDWADLDREVVPDHLTCLYVPSLSVPVAAELQRIAELVVLLRRECPWDQEQTHDSLTKHLVEETYEVLDAIDHLDSQTLEGYDHLEEELGDLLYQVLFHATLAAEAGQFTIADVAGTIYDKLYLRHPHVFGDVQADDADTVRRNWEQIKKDEKGRDSVLDGIAPGLPALVLALKVQKKSRALGMDFASVPEVHAKIAEELAEVTADPTDDELGDVLFAVVALAMHLGLDPEGALRRATARFADRLRVVERLAGERSIDLTTADPAALDVLWEEAKVVVGAGGR